MHNFGSRRVPYYCHHKPSGQAVVTIDGRDIYLGTWNTSASRREYDRLIGEWLAAGRRLPWIPRPWSNCARPTGGSRRGTTARTANPPAPSSASSWRFDRGARWTADPSFQAARGVC